MIKVMTKITNKKTSPVSLSLPQKRSTSVKVLSLGPSKVILLDFDVWSKLSQVNRLRLLRLIRTNQISVDTVVVTEDNKLITINLTDVNITQGDKRACVKAVKERNDPKEITDKKLDTTFRTTLDRNVLKGYKVVEGSDSINKLGFIESRAKLQFDHSKALGNNNDTKGFAEIDLSKVLNLNNKNILTDTKSDTVNIFNNQNNKQAVNESASVPLSITLPVSALSLLVIPNPVVPTLIISKMLLLGDIDGLKNYLSLLYPLIKFTKKAIKLCKTALDIKNRFGLNDLL